MAASRERTQLASATSQGSMPPVSQGSMSPSFAAADLAGMEVECHVSGIAGPICSVRFDVASPVADLRAAVEAKSGIPAAEQRLFHGFRELGSRSDLGCVLPEEGAEHVELMLVKRSQEVVSWLQRVDSCTVSCEAMDWLRHVAPPAAREHHEVVLAAVEKDDRLALPYVPYALWRDRSFVLAVVAQDSDALRYLGPDLRADREVVLTALARSLEAVKHAATEVWSDREFVLDAVAMRGRLLQHAAAQLRGDREVVLAAIAQDERAWWYVRPTLWVALRLEELRTRLRGCCGGSRSLRDAADVAPLSQQSPRASMGVAISRAVLPAPDIEGTRVADSSWGYK